MDQNPLQQFARQLHTWASDELRQTPGPFRAVELFPNLLGENGDIAPPIVFWINRESHLAGGVILLPKNNPTEITDSGREICAALGLNSYYSWGISEVSAWRIDTPVGRQWTEPIPDTAMHETGTVKEILTLLIKNMQNRFFSNQQDLPKLSSSYMANLLHHCCESALQTQTSEVSVSSPVETIETQRSTIACVMLQMLALNIQNGLRIKTRPSRLVPDLNQQLEQLPSPLLAALRLSSANNLSEAATIKLHHLHQRLQQLGPKALIFLPETIARLLQFWSESAKLSPLPAALKKNRPTLIINPDRYYPEMSISIEIAAPPLTAATALLRFLQSPDRRHPYQLSDLLDLRKPIFVDEVIGNLTDRSKPTVSEQAHLNTLLRHSWPNRQLKLPSASPRWLWRIIHLVGLLQGTPQGILTLPADWLWAPYGEQFFNLFTERIALSRITPLTNNLLQVRFNQSTKKQQVSIDSFDKDVRVIDISNKEITRAELLLALSSPADVYDLLRSDELKPVKDVNPPLGAIKLFLKSSIGKGLWKCLTLKKKLPKDEKLLKEIIRTELPLPGKKILSALTLLSHQQTEPDTAAIDRELEAWLGSACLTNFRPPFQLTVAQSTLSTQSNPAEQMTRDLIQSGEVPLFPMNYLYAIPEKERRNYSIPGTLSHGETFFNSVTLLTPTGDEIQIEGAATARALLLISTMQTGKVDLPDDEHQVELILNRYFQDLHQLLKRIQQSATDSTYSAKTDLIDQIWHQLPVPPRTSLDNN